MINGNILRIKLPKTCDIEGNFKDKILIYLEIPSK